MLLCSKIRHILPIPAVTSPICAPAAKSLRTPCLPCGPPTAGPCPLRAPGPPPCAAEPPVPGPPAIDECRLSDDAGPLRAPAPAGLIGDELTGARPPTRSPGGGGSGSGRTAPLGSRRSPPAIVDDGAGPPALAPLA